MTKKRVSSSKLKTETILSKVTPRIIAAPLCFPAPPETPKCFIPFLDDLRVAFIGARVIRECMVGELLSTWDHQRGPWKIRNKTHHVRLASFCSRQYILRLLFLQQLLCGIAPLQMKRSSFEWDWLNSTPCSLFLEETSIPRPRNKLF